MNVTCHPEFFKFFHVNPYHAPTVVFYNPGRHRHGTITSELNRDVVLYDMGSFAGGKLAMHKTPRPLDKMLITEKVDCSAPSEENESELDYEEILAFNVAEEAQIKLQEEEDARQAQLATKKKKKKKKKGRKTTEEKDEF